jgi:hypothetical protein
MRWAIIAALWLSAGSLSAEQFVLFTYQVIGDEIEITDHPAVVGGSIEIPADIDGMPVTSIGEYAFHRCAPFTSVSIPESITKIGDHAFERCTGLTSVSIPDGVTVIGDNVFRDCTGLTSVSEIQDTHKFRYPRPGY